jgi:serine/threonine protein phosphatase 1
MRSGSCVYSSAPGAECVAWMKTLPCYHDTPEVRVVHAAMVPGVPLASQDEDVLAGTTPGDR